MQIRQETLLHIDTCTQNERKIKDKPRGSVLTHRSYSAELFVWYYQSSERYDDTEELYKRALAGREDKLGPDYPDTLRTASNFAIYFEDLGRVNDADLLLARFEL